MILTVAFTISKETTYLGSFVFSTSTEIIEHSPSRRVVSAPDKNQLIAGGGGGGGGGAGGGAGALGGAGAGGGREGKKRREPVNTPPVRSRRKEGRKNGNSQKMTRTRISAGDGTPGLDDACHDVKIPKLLRKM